MRKLVIVFLAMICILSCYSPKAERAHIYHTYYGDIDIDTMEAALTDDDGSLCFIVHTAEKDSVEKAPGIWGYIIGPIVIYYNPSKKVYYRKFHSNDENGHVIAEFNPYTK